MKFRLLVLLFVVADGQHFPSVQQAHQCVPIEIQLCSDLPYNSTMLPNLLQHEKQEDAALAINQFAPLVKVKCSEDIKLFLCTVYAPLCTPQLPKPLPPCRELCLSAKHGCESLMVKFGFRWPAQLDCDHFPMQEQEICVGENKTSSSSSKGVTSLPSALMECPTSMRVVSGTHFTLPLANGGILRECSLPCAADGQVPMLFDHSLRRVLRLWTGAWSVACCVCSLFTIMTFLVDLGRFQYPVRPILYMAMCYLALSIVFMAGVGGEERFACGHYGGQQALVTQGAEKVSCSALAVVHYFFSMASCMWWVILCLAWFLHANLKWGAESIASYAAYFHALAWGVPAILAAAVLVTNVVDGDVLTGICSVGNLKPEALFYFLFVPTIVCLGIGFLLLICGIWSMVRIRSYIKLQHADHNINKLEKLMLRVSAFAVMYALPTAVSAAILLYQVYQTPLWIEGWYTIRCSLPTGRDDFGFTQQRSDCPKRVDGTNAQPDVLVFLIKYTVQLVVGITCAVWVCSTKTLNSYHTAYARIVHRQVTGPQ